MGGKGLTEPICPFLFLNPFPPRPNKIGPFVILLYLTPDDFTREGRASVWERVKRDIKVKLEGKRTNTKNQTFYFIGRRKEVVPWGSTDFKTIFSNTK